MRRHDQGQRAAAKAMKLVGDAGWTETSSVLVAADLPGETPSLNREFGRDGSRDSLLVASSTSLDVIHWHLSITFPSRVVNGVTMANEAHDSFRVFSFTSLRNPSETGCEFVVYRKNWEGLAHTEQLFLNQLKTRLDEEANSTAHRFTHGELRKMSHWQWQGILLDHGIPEKDYLDLDRWKTWDLLQRVLVQERALAYSDEPKHYKRRSMSPQRTEASPRGEVFWVKAGIDEDYHPARMALPDESPNFRKEYVYLFGTGRLALLKPGDKKKTWTSYTTNATKHARGIAEAKKYAGI
jgi:hypothetical protein